MTDIRNKEEFEKALNHSGIQVMMFTAFWCPDCMYIKPFLPEIEEEFNDLQFYSLNRDQCMASFAFSTSSGFKRSSAPMLAMTLAAAIIPLWAMEDFPWAVACQEWSAVPAA